MPVVGAVLAERYRVDGLLGTGAMASVHLATDLRLELQVAIKVLLPNLSQDPELVERFDREARMLALVAHPNIVEVFDVQPGDIASAREPFYVMELCRNGSLAGRIDASGPLEPSVLVPWLVAVGDALEELHGQGIIHRDVKPANILFTAGRPKLGDFGLAKPGDWLGLATLTQPGTAIGTPGYMAPELVSGAIATVASDVYALAATAFHGLTGHAPRQTNGLTGLIAAMAEPLPHLSSVSPRLGAGFDAVIGAGLSDDPADRQSLAALIAGLVAALDTRVAHAGQSEPARPRRGEDRRGPRGDRWTPRAGAQRGSGD